MYKHYFWWTWKKVSIKFTNSNTKLSICQSKKEICEFKDLDLISPYQFYLGNLGRGFTVHKI